MKHVRTLLLVAFLLTIGHTGYCSTQTDSLPSYYSSDKQIFSFTTSSNIYLPNSSKGAVFIYKIFSRDSLIDQYWIHEGWLIKLKTRNSEFLSSLLTKDTVAFETILNTYRLTEKSYASRFDSFFQIEFQKIHQKSGHIYGCGQDREGHKTTFDVFTLKIKRNKKIYFSRKFKIKMPSITEFKNDINNMFVFYSKDSIAFIAYGELSYQYDSIFWMDDQLLFFNKK